MNWSEGLEVTFISAWLLVSKTVCVSFCFLHLLFWLDRLLGGYKISWYIARLSRSDDVYIPPIWITIKINWKYKSLFFPRENLKFGLHVFISVHIYIIPIIYNFKDISLFKCYVSRVSGRVIVKCHQCFSWDPCNTTRTTSTATSAKELVMVVMSMSMGVCCSGSMMEEHVTGTGAIWSGNLSVTPTATANEPIATSSICHRVEWVSARLLKGQLLR